MVIDTTGFQLQTSEERKQTKQHLTHMSKSYLISEFEERCKEALKEDESLADRVDELIGILNDLDRVDKILDRPSVEIVDWNDIEIIDREWLIPNWLPANTATMFTGDGGAGKSWLTLQAVCQIACGYKNAFLDPSFEMPSEADDSVVPRPVVFATYEDEPAEIKRRLQALASGIAWIAASMETIKRHLHIVDMRGIGSVWGPGMGKHIALTGDLLSAGEELRAICEDQNAGSW